MQSFFFEILIYVLNKMLMQELFKVGSGPVKRITDPDPVC